MKNQVDQEDVEMIDDIISGGERSNPRKFTFEPFRKQSPIEKLGVESLTALKTKMKEWKPAPNVANAWTNRPHWSRHQQDIQKQQQQDQQKFFPKTISAGSGNMSCATAVTTSSDTSTIANLRNEMADMKKAHTEMNDRRTRMEKSEGETKKTLTTIQTEQEASRRDLSDQINTVEKNMGEKLETSNAIQADLMKGIKELLMRTPTEK